MNLVEAVNKLNEDLIYYANTKSEQLYVNDWALPNLNKGTYYLHFYEKLGAGLYKKETYKQITFIINTIINKSKDLTTENIYFNIYKNNNDLKLCYTLLKNIDEQNIKKYKFEIRYMLESGKLYDHVMNILLKLCNRDGLYEIFTESYSQKLPMLLKKYMKAEDENTVLKEKIIQLEKQIKKLNMLIEHYEYSPGGPGYNLAKNEFEVVSQKV